jgi:hypothetical protein
MRSACPKSHVERTWGEGHAAVLRRTAHRATARPSAPHDNDGALPLYDRHGAMHRVRAHHLGEAARPRRDTGGERTTGHYSLHSATFGASAAAGLSGSICGAAMRGGYGLGCAGGATRPWSRSQAASRRSSSTSRA